MNLALPSYFLTHRSLPLNKRFFDDHFSGRKDVIEKSQKILARISSEGWLQDLQLSSKLFMMGDFPSPNNIKIQSPFCIDFHF
jgi:hypothetical protein